MTKRLPAAGQVSTFSAARDAAEQQPESFAAHLSYARELMLRLIRDQASPPDRPGHRLAQRDPHDAAYRLVRLEARTLTGSRWSDPCAATVTVTGRHLTLTQTATGHLLCLRWSQLTTFTADLTRAELILDRSAGPRLSLIGPAVPVIAVVGVASLYGSRALHDHPALRLVREHRPEAPAVT